MPHPYRTEDGEPSVARAELIYDVVDHERSLAPARTALQLGIGIAGAIVAVLLAGAGSPFAGAGTLVTTAGILAWRGRRTPATGIVLVVERGELVVTAQASKTVLTRTRLVDLEDVSLDTKTIRKVLPGRDAIPAVQFINTSVGPELDVSRIVLTFAHGEPVRLTERFLAHMDGVEWAGKIRSFLRREGWVPADERDA